MAKELEVGKIYKHEARRKDGGTWMAMFVPVLVDGELTKISIRATSFLEGTLLQKIAEFVPTAELPF